MFECIFSSFFICLIFIFIWFYYNAAWRFCSNTHYAHTQCVLVQAISICFFLFLFCSRSRLSCCFFSVVYVLNTIFNCKQREKKKRTISSPFFIYERNVTNHRWIIFRTLCINGFSWLHWHLHWNNSTFQRACLIIILLLLSFIANVLYIWFNWNCDSFRWRVWRVRVYVHF